MDDGVGLSPSVMQRFVELLSADLGRDKFTAILTKAGLQKEWARSDYFHSLDEGQAAQAYSRLQSALRTYYGRGARGILVHVGGKLWNTLLRDAALGVRIQAALVRGLPAGLKRKRALELIPRLLHARSGAMTVHTLDLDLVFVDHASSTALGESQPAPICFVTLGLIRECLCWAFGYEHDIEEIACRAAGAQDCEFRITTGG